MKKQFKMTKKEKAILATLTGPKKTAMKKAFIDAALNQPSQPSQVKKKN